MSMSPILIPNDKFPIPYDFDLDEKYLSPIEARLQCG